MGANQTAPIQPSAPRTSLFFNSTSMVTMTASPTCSTASSIAKTGEAQNAVRENMDEGPRLSLYLGSKLYNRVAATLGILVSGQERGAMWACIAHERRATPPEPKRPASLRVAGKMADW